MNPYTDHITYHLTKNKAPIFYFYLTKITNKISLNNINRSIKNIHTQILISHIQSNKKILQNIPSQSQNFNYSKKKHIHSAKNTQSIYKNKKNTTSKPTHVQRQRFPCKRSTFFRPILVCTVRSKDLTTDPSTYASLPVQIPDGCSINRTGRKSRRDMQIFGMHSICISGECLPSIREA